MAIKVKDDERKNMRPCQVCTILNPASAFGTGSCQMVSNGSLHLLNVVRDIEKLRFEVVKIVVGEDKGA